MPEKNLRLKALEDQYPLGGRSMATEDGILWENRSRASEAYFNDYSWDWEDNLALLVDVRAMADKYSHYLMLAYPIIQNFVANTYYRNPDPLIQDKNGDKDLSRMCTDLAASVHREIDSEKKMQMALFDQSWAGVGYVLPSFLQRAEEAEDGEIVPLRQEVRLEHISPWRVRHDPRGKRWGDLSDHGYLSILIFPRLSAMISWPFLTDDDRCRIMAWVRGGQRADSFNEQRIAWHEMTDQQETDPDYIEVPTWAHWDRTKKKVYYQPAGARFTAGPQDWDEEFAAEDEFPILCMMKRYDPQNKRGDTGFMGIPDIRLIKPNLTTINRLERLFVAANQHVVWKYLMPKGALSDENRKKLYTDVQREVVEYDRSDPTFPDYLSQNREFSVDEILKLVPQPDLKETRHLVGIQHELDMIAQIMSQSSGDRGGMPTTETATDARIINERLNLMMATLRHEAGKHYNKLTKFVIMILKHRQELPLRYQMTTRFNQKVWTTFSLDTLRNLDLHFDYATGSSEPKTREQEFALHERMAAILLPMLQANGDTRTGIKIARDMAELLGLRDIEQYFNDEVTALLKELATLFYGIQKGEIDPAAPNVVKMQIELVAKILNEMLPTADLAEVMANFRGAPQPEGGSMGSLPAAPTPGEMSFDNASRGAAAAGEMGGMA